MSKIRQFIDPQDDVPVFPTTVTNAVYDQGGTSLDALLQGANASHIKYTDALSREEIAASTSLTNKIPSAAAFKSLNSDLYNTKVSFPTTSSILANQDTLDGSTYVEYTVTRNCILLINAVNTKGTFSAIIKNNYVYGAQNSWEIFSVPLKSGEKIYIRATTFSAVMLF